MKNKILAIFFIFLAIACFSTCFSNVEADILNDIFSSGGSFLNSGKNLSASDPFANSLKHDIFDSTGLGLIGAFSLIGNVVFLIITVVLGVKYIFSGIEGKSNVKETLPTFVIGIVFFYLAENLVNFFTDIGGQVQNTTNPNILIGSVWKTVSSIVQIVSIAGIIFIGLKYMMSPSYKKADIKNQAIAIVLGLMLVTTAVPILEFVIGIGSELL